MLVFVSFLLLFSSCKDSAIPGVNAPVENAPKSAPTSHLDTIDTQHFTSLLNAYYGLKDAMIEGDAAAINVAAKKVSLIASEVEIALSTDSLGHIALLPYIDSLKNTTENIRTTKDETAEHQRIVFEKTSDAMYGAIMAIEYRSSDLYRQYCPMAMNDKGAYWLSNETEIRNPYFGNKMLECGETTDTLK